MKTVFLGTCFANPRLFMRLVIHITANPSAPLLSGIKKELLSCGTALWYIV
jgi:hypothetical protein